MSNGYPPKGPDRHAYDRGCVIAIVVVCVTVVLITFILFPHGVK